MSWRSDLESRMETGTTVPVTAVITFPTLDAAADAAANDTVGDILADAVGVEDAREQVSGRVVTVIADVWAARDAEPGSENERVSDLVRQGLRDGLPEATVTVTA